MATGSIVSVHLNVQRGTLSLQGSQSDLSLQENQDNGPGKMTSRNPPKNIWRITALFFWLISQGFNDATPGALLPYMEEYYGITYTVVSLIWMANAAGYIFVALWSPKIQPWFGREKALVIGNVSSLIMYAIVLSGTAFPAVVVGFFLGGVGMATVSSQANVFLTRLHKLSKYLSFCHASYGVGGTISPLLATAMASSGIAWHYFYIILLGMLILNCILFVFAFKGSDKDLAPWDSDEPDKSPRNDEEGISMNNLGPSTQVAPTTTATTEISSSNLKEAVCLPNTWLLAFFVLFYQGSEVSLAGWIVTFLLDYRNGPASVGYVASGFWAGLTIGRLVLTRPMDVKFGIRRSITIVSIISLIIIGLAWAIENTIAVGVLVCIAGFFIGPNYPLTISIVADLIPRKLQVISLTIITAFGSSGGGFIPIYCGDNVTTVGTICSYASVFNTLFAYDCDVVLFTEY